MPIDGERSQYRLKAWSAALGLVIDIYRISRGFPDDERFGLAIGMRRSAVSIAGNIAEGAARHSKKEFLRFLGTASGSLGERDTQLIIAARLGYVHDSESVNTTMCLVNKLLSGLIRSLSEHNSTVERFPKPGAR